VKEECPKEWKKHTEIVKERIKNIINDYKNEVKIEETDKKKCEVIQNFILSIIENKIDDIVYYLVNRIGNDLYIVQRKEFLRKQTAYNSLTSDLTAIMSFIIAREDPWFCRMISIEDLIEEARQQLESMNRKSTFDSLLEQYCYYMFNSIFDLLNKDYELSDNNNNENIKEKYNFQKLSSDDLISKVDSIDNYELKNPFTGKAISKISKEVRQVIGFLLDSCFDSDKNFGLEHDEKAAGTVDDPGAGPDRRGPGRSRRERHVRPDTGGRRAEG
jgi:hypothetical protein